jgi:hypothetical protein
VAGEQMRSARLRLVTISLACVLAPAMSGVIASSPGGTAVPGDGLRVFDLRVGGSDPFVRPHPLANSEAVDLVALPDGDIVVLLAHGAPSLVRIDRQGRGHGVPVPAYVDPERENSVVAAPGGALLFSERGRVLRVEPDGRVVTVAGGPRSQSASGDGGPAVGAGMDPAGLALLPDGSLLIADSLNNRIRRVDPTGQISTVAGTGRPGADGDGGPATAARLTEPVSLAAYPDGSYLIAHGLSHVRVRRVDAAGRITTVMGSGPPKRQPCRSLRGLATSFRFPADQRSGKIAALPDGGFLIAANVLGDTYRLRAGGVMRVSAAGAVTPVLCESGAYPYRADGRDLYASGRAVADAFTVDPPSSLAVTADGGIVAGYGERDTSLRLLAPPGSQRFGVAVAPRTLASVFDRQVMITATSAATVRVSVYRERRLVQDTVRRVRPGENRLRLPRRLGSGVHELRVLATTADGRTATDRLSVLGRPRLTISYAMRRLRRVFADYIAGDGTFGLRLSECRRGGPRLVRCRADFVFDFGIPAQETLSLGLRPDGVLQFAWGGSTPSAHAITP